MANEVKVIIAGQNTAGPAFSQAEQQLQGLATAAGRFGQILTGLGGLLVIEKIGRMVESAAEAAHGFELLSQKTGIGVVALQDLSYAAKVSGADTDALEKGLRFLSKNMVDAAAGVLKPAAAFHALGVSVTDVNGKTRPVIDVFRDLADRFQAMPAGANKAAESIAIFGRSGTKMIAVLDQGSSGLDQLTARFQAMGAEVSEKDLAALAAFARNMKDLQEVADALGRQFAIGMVPALHDVANALLDMTGGMSAAETAGHAFGETFRLVVASILSVAATARMGWAALDGFAISLAHVEGGDPAGMGKELDKHFASIDEKIQKIADDWQHTMAVMYGAEAPKLPPMPPRSKGSSDADFADALRKGDTGDAAGKARLAAREKTASLLEEQEKKTAEQIFKIQEAGIKQQVALEIQGGMDRAQAELQALPAMAVAQEQLTQAKLAAAQKDYESQKAAQQDLINLLGGGGKGTGTDEAALIAAKAKLNEIEMKYQAERQSIVAAGNLALAALDLRSIDERTTLARQGEADRLRAMEEGMRERLQVARQDAEEGIAAIKSAADIQDRELDDDAKNRLISMQAWRAARLAILQQEEADLRGVLEAEKSAMVAEQAALMGAMVAPGVSSEQVRQLMADFDKLTISIGKVVGEEQKMGQQLVLKINSDAAAITQQRMKNLEQEFRQLGAALGSTFENAVINLDFGLKTVVAGLQDIERAMLRAFVTKPMEDWFAALAKNAGSSGGFFSSLLGMFGLGGGGAGGMAFDPGAGFAWSFASGGDYGPGWRVVGENGPELDYVGHSGTVVSNPEIRAALGGGGGNNYTYNIDARGATAGERERMMAALAQTENRAVARSVNAMAQINRRA